MVGSSNARRRSTSRVSSTPTSSQTTPMLARGNGSHKGHGYRVSFLQRMPESKVLDGIESKVRRNVWRDFLLLLFGCAALTAISYVENHASDERHFFGKYDSNNTIPTDTMGHIVDTGFSITTPIYNFLKQHRHTYNDLFAFLNSLVLLIPGAYGSWTIYQGDYSYIFRILFTQLLRSFCGWATYLPPSKQYLMSYYDFPDVVQCLFQDCSSNEEQVAMPFVSFFSGHVATMVICANHMYLMGYFKSAIMVHFFNALQIVRLLATRGHYSIDIIVGWFIAVQGSNPAGRLGRYYSRGDSFRDMLLPTTATEAFESLTGVSGVRHESRVSALLKHTDMEQMLRAVQQQDEEAQELLGASSDDD